MTCPAPKEKIEDSSNALPDPTFIVSSSKTMFSPASVTKNATAGKGGSPSSLITS